MPPKAPLDDCPLRRTNRSSRRAGIRLLRSKRLGLSFALMLIVDAAVAIGLVYASIATPDLLDSWTVACLVPVAFLLLVITLGAEAEWHFLRKDLRAGAKLYSNGRIASVRTHDDGESSATYTVSVVIDDQSRRSASPYRKRSAARWKGPAGAGRLCPAQPHPV